MSARLMGMTAGALTVALALVACARTGAGGGNEKQTPTVTPALTPTFTATPPPPPTATPDPATTVQLNQTASQTVDGIALHIVGLDRTSPHDSYPTLGAACAPSLVFTAPQPSSASPATVQAMRAYLSSLAFTHSGYPAPSANERLPSGLRWVQGGQDGCFARFEVTNRTANPVTLTGVKLRLLSAATTNPYSYHLLEVCSLQAPNYGVACGSPSNGPDNYYSSEVMLGTGGAGAEYAGEITQDYNANPLLYTLPAQLKTTGDTRLITVSILPPNADITTSRIYRVAPELTINDGAVHTIVFSQLISTIVFTARTQSDCYGLLGDRVAPLSQLPVSVQSMALCY
jgi:hypothetical protein